MESRFYVLLSKAHPKIIIIAVIRMNVYVLFKAAPGPGFIHDS